MNTKPLKVLIVEDRDPRETQWFQVLADGVEAGHYELKRAETLSKAQALLEIEPLDLIMIDLAQGDLQGFNLFSWFYTRVPEIPIITTSNIDNEEKALLLLREGAQDYIIKDNVDAASLRRAMVYAIERHQTRILLQQLSFNDDLTGLLNRRGFLSMAQQQLKIAQRESWEVVLFFADLDSLKTINDNFGHLEGDRALQTVATVLKETFRTSDLIARLGGDEFIVLALNAPATGLEVMLNRLRRNLDRHNSQNQFYNLTLSIGSSRFDPHSAKSLEDMIMEADKDLYEHKRGNRTTPTESELSELDTGE
jgi:diguanylate cyclase (GGDEF)-like protein